MEEDGGQTRYITELHADTVECFDGAPVEPNMTARPRTTVATTFGVHGTPSNPTPVTVGCNRMWQS